ncbi:MAG TPA: 3-isopropylmalate dehydratase small subunit [Symbiobacteriaceae bacterium]|nr:3-isopropylmalate dehydratase small subunit [Symbiobacteriaceae bacterium]
MEPFVRHTGRAVPMDRVNVDTDQIMPKQFLKRIERTGFGQFVFDDWRQDPAFELNQPRYKGATVLVAGKNFGCGSSREHAPWGLADYGFRAIIAPSFADIFHANCFKNFLLPVTLSEAEVAELMRRAASFAAYSVTIDLSEQVVTDAYGFTATFAVDPFRRHMLMNGLDEIGLTLQQEPAITAYEARRPAYRRGFAV